MPDKPDDWTEGIEAEEKAEKVLEQTSSRMTSGEGTKEEYSKAAGDLHQVAERNKRGCVPSATVIGLVLAILAGTIAAAVLTGRDDDDKTSESTPPPAASGDVTVYEGSSGGSVGCVPCDGQARFIRVDGRPGVVPGTTGQAQAGVELPAGTYRNLKIEVDRADRGRWNMNLGAIALGCVLEPGARSCTSAGPAVLTEPAVVALFIGNDGDPTIYDDRSTDATNPNGSPTVAVDPKTDGAFVMTFTFEYSPS